MMAIIVVCNIVMVGNCTLDDHVLLHQYYSQFMTNCHMIILSEWIINVTQVT